MAAKKKTAHARKVSAGMRKYHKRSSHKKSAAGSRKAAWKRWGKKRSKK
jgi:hypothetical protein